ncbi:MAG: OmpA family protein [Bacteroidota bacterium]|nr:OmpA family protein [Bacteroidota bacterium]
MKIKSLVILTLSIITLMSFVEVAFAQENLKEKEFSNGKLFRQSKRFANAGEYDVARRNLLILVEREPNKFIYNYELGLNYYYTFHSKEEAIPYFENAVKNSPKDTIGELFFYLGDLYQHTGELAKAIDAYSIMKRFVKDNKAGRELYTDVNLRIAQCYGGKAFAIAVDKKVKVENMGSNINSRFSEYSPVINIQEDIIMFTSRRSTTLGGKKDYRDDDFFEDMYISRKGESGFLLAEKFLVSDKYIGLIPNSPKHDAVVGFSSDEKKLLTFRDNSLWISYLTEEGNWQGPEKLNENINDKKSYQPHAAVSPDGKTMYFSSDRKNGAGGLDIYKSSLQTDGSWGEIENLGLELNTKFDEDSPYISEDGKTLYFSSKGHNTIGGYDIFYSKFLDGKWSQPVNLGRPVNSMADDIYYTPIKDGKQAYFSSSRPEGLGNMDIYRLTYLSEPEFKECIVINDITNDSPELTRFITFSNPDTIIKGQQVVFDASKSRVNDSEIGNVYWLFDNGETAEQLKTSHTFDTLGLFEVKMELEAFHKTKLTTNNYCVSKFINVIEKVAEPLIADANQATQTDKEKVAANESDYGFEKIYYDFNNLSIRNDAKIALDKNISILKANPEIKIQIIAHTDSKGSAKYNLRLSQKRANSAAQYLVKNGISAKRIQAVVGSGEALLVNKCTEDIECSDQEHELNRRAEFIVVGN